MPKINFKECADAMMEEAKETMSRTEAESFVKSVITRLENSTSEKQLTNVDAKISQIGKELTGEMASVNMLNRRNALMAVSAARKLTKSAKAYKTPFEGILAYLEDSRRNIESAGRGVNAIIEGYKNKYMGLLKQGLMKSGVLDKFMSDELEKEIFQEFYGQDSGSKDAKAIKDVVLPLKQDQVRTQNLYGSYINFRADHVKRQTYNTNLIKKNFGPDRFKNFINIDRHLTPEEYNQTFQNWKDFMSPLLDHEETFKDSNKDEFMRSAFDGIMSGKHGTIEPATGAEINTKFFKTGAMANKASAQRLFHYKDGDSAYAAHKAFSAETLSRGIVNELSHASTNIGLMQQLGPNPVGTLTETLGRLEFEYSRSGEEAKLRSLQENKHKVMSALAFLDKSAMTPANPSLATATSSAMQLLSMAKLGKMVFFALPDRALTYSMLTRNGMKGMDALGAALNVRKPSNPDEHLRLVMLGSEARSFINSVASRFGNGSESGVPTVISNTQRAFFKYTGIHWIDDANAGGIVGALPRHLGAMADRSFNNLIPELKNMFITYGITPSDWDAMRSTAYKDGKDTWVTPDKFKDIPDSTLNNLLKERGIPLSENNRARQSDLLDNKYRTWLTAQRDEAVPLPGSKEHRLTSFGTQPGTALGSMTRLLMMFKTFPVSVYTKILRREMYGNGATTFGEWLTAEKNSNFHTTQLIAMSTIAGYLAVTSEDILDGKTPRKFTDDQGNFNSAQSLDILKESFLRGGAGSLQADMMLREYDSGRNNIVKAIGGPAVGFAVDSAAALSADIRGEGKASANLKLVKDNLPWSNLFYLKPAIDHLVWFNIQEMLDPGSLREMERNNKEKFNQDYWLKPSEIHQNLKQ